MGVFLRQAVVSFILISLPHARGGVSDGWAYFPSRPQSSPRTWGCFPFPHLLLVRSHVFPTHVGVFLWHKLADFSAYCLPHARGGVSDTYAELIKQKRSSPRTWGCFSRATASGAASGVFPTHVGVFLIVSFKESSGLCLPHARGGVSDASSMLLA